MKDPTFWLLARASGLTAYVLLTLSVLAGLAVKSTVHIGLAALLVPGLSGYRPVATGLGVLAAELAAVIVVSFPLRKRIGARAWRRLHWATYGVFAAATAHGIAAGTDSHRPWIFALYLGAVFAVAAATAWRALTRPSRTKGVQRVPDRDRPVTV